MNNGPFYAKGNYTAEVTGQGFVEASTGNTQFLLKFRVMEYADGRQVDEQYERTARITLTDKTIDRFIDDMQSLGFTGDSFRDLDPGTTDYHSFEGQSIQVYCQHKPDKEGKVWENWGISNRNGGSAPVEPMEQTKLRKLDSLFGSQLKAATRRGAAKKQPARPAQPATAVANGVDDEDFIPF